MARRVGVFGGTFDPIHLGHLAAARAAAEALALDLVVFVPAGDPYHRDEPQAKGADRLAMLEAAVQDDPLFRVSRVDLDRPGPTYTVDTLRDLQREFPDARLVLLLGSDALTALPTWRAPEEILTLAEVAGFARPGEALLAPGMDADVTLLPMEPLPISATLVRGAIARGEALDALVPKSVIAVIADRRLYEVN
jgi:nicotinate-nucleotide adenylyltransferase